MKILGVFIIRGSGSPGFNSQEDFIEKVKEDLHKRKIDPEWVQFQVANWYGPLEEQQNTLYERVKKVEKLKAKWVRKFLLKNISDLITYGGRPNLSVQMYEAIHRTIFLDIQALQAELVPRAPLIIIASSMGTEIINNHIWDRQKFAVARHSEGQDQLGTTDFEKMETLFGLFTLGHNLPLFASAYPVDELRPIRFPGMALQEGLIKGSVWENIYDKNDPFGYPIREINGHYRQSRIRDIEINVGGILSSWNLASHFMYWKSGRVRRRIVDFIEKNWAGIQAQVSDPLPPLEA